MLTLAFFFSKLKHTFSQKIYLHILDSNSLHCTRVLGMLLLFDFLEIIKLEKKIDELSCFSTAIVRQFKKPPHSEDFQ